MLIPRSYQAKAITAGVNYFHSDARHHAMEILPTGSGKSVVIANIAKELEDNTLILQPSKEILEQNYMKYTGYGFRAGIYSASAGQKHREKVTFAMIGSVINKAHLFKKHRKVIIDECHLVNPEEGMYQELIHSIPDAQVLGMTATPFRLSSVMGEGSMLTFLNRSQPRIFKEVLYCIQTKELFDAGHLAKLRYFKYDMIDRNRLELNKIGSDYTPESIRAYFRSIDMVTKTADCAREILKQRKNLLVFCSLVSDAYRVSKKIPGSMVLTGDTPDAERVKILSMFKSGKLRCLINVGVLTTGFDYPQLEAVLMERATMSLSLFYQMVGRGMRVHPLKEDCWIVDLGGNIDLFGKIETLTIEKNSRGEYAAFNNGRQLTDVTFSRN